MDQYGSDFLTIVDEDGNEFELEVLSTLEYNGCTYLAVIPAAETAETLELEVSILKSVEEDGEPILCAIEDDGVMVQDKNGMQFKIAADNVILSTGYRSAPLAEKSKHVHIIGDAFKVGNLRTVIWQAWDVCMKI